MKKLILTNLFAVLALGFAEAQTTRNLSSFSKVSVQEGIEVVMKKGSTEKAVILSSNKPEDEVLTEVTGDRLKIHLEGNNHRNVDVRIEVTFRKLEGLSASSAGSIEVTDEIIASGDFDVDVSSAGSIEARIKADEIDVDASSSGDAKLRVEADELSADISSAGDVEVEGIVRYQYIEASSSGDYDGMDVSGAEAKVSVSSGGSAKVNVSEKIDARASSGGSVRYSGSPKYVDVSSSSGGSVKKS